MSEAIKVKQIPVKCYILPNGMIIVFDRFGEQVSRYQGTVYPNLIKLQGDYPGVVVESHSGVGFGGVK